MFIQSPKDFGAVMAESGALFRVTDLPESNPVTVSGGKNGGTFT